MTSHIKTVDQMLIFDVDGVITNLQTRQISDPLILEELIKRLKLEIPIAFITGRAHKWITERVIDKLENMIGDRMLLDNLFTSEEFGGLQSFYKNGARIDSKNENFLIPQEIFSNINEIVTNQYYNSMFVDPDKETMISIEMKKDFPIGKFKLLQEKLINQLQLLIERYDSKKIFEIHKDHIATNIKNKNSSKRYATKQMLAWLFGREIDPKKYIVFGDNISDKEIPDELHENDKIVEFVFVGKSDDLKNVSPKYKITLKDSKFEKGTLEYLKSQP
jgi:hydroxymethylpyrimidine pyrophosphatase-like HAD family hydrolase